MFVDLLRWLKPAARRLQEPAFILASERKLRRNSASRTPQADTVSPPANAGGSWAPPQAYARGSPSLQALRRLTPAARPGAEWHRLQLIVNPLGGPGHQRL